jgi:HK97 family phage prohead protease
MPAGTAPAGVEYREKYTQDEIDKLGAKGEAFKNDDGSYSYPIADTDDLKDAIRAVGRGNADHDAIRKYIIGRAKDLNESDLIPDTWNADGSLKDDDAKSRVWRTFEQRDTAMDVFTALDGAVSDAYDGTYYYTWVQDWYGSGVDDDPYTVVYYAGGDIWAATFAYDDDQKITIDTTNARKVRPCTTYVDRNRWTPEKRNKALPSRPRSVDAELRSARDGMRGFREERRMPTHGFAMREQTDNEGRDWVVCSGYASRTCSSLSDDANAYEMEDSFGPWVESTVRGFATKTIQDGCDTAFLVNHTGVSMARTKAGTLSLDERNDGLFYEGQLNPVRPDVQILRAAVQDGAVDESSFAFRVVRQKWSDDYTRRWIQEINLDKGDVSPVNYGANPHTADAPLAMRALAAQQRGMIVALKRSKLFQELREGKVLSAANQSQLQTALDALHEADDQDIPAIVLALQTIDSAIDAGQAALSAVLGTANPDGDAGDLNPDLEPADDDESRASTLVLPDHTLRARAELERIRSRA